MGILFELGKELVKTLEDGALDTDQVWVQFICQTGPAGEHDPDDDPDDHVRASHAAFHGQVFKMADAPIPPLDYGCRCAIRYVAKPASDAEKILDVVAPTDDTTTATDATKGWLTNNVPGWPSLAKIALEAKPKEAIGLVQQAAKAAKIAEPRQVAEMVVDVAKAEPKATAEAAAAPKPTPPAVPAAPPAVPSEPLGAALETPVAAAPAPVASLTALPKAHFWDVEAGGKGEGLATELTPKFSGEMEEVAAAVSKDIAPRIRRAVRSYTGSDYAKICDADAGKTFEEAGMTSRKEWMQAQVDAAKINEMLDSAPKVTTTLWRGLKNVPEADVLQMINSGSVQFNSMASTSYDAGAAAKFTISDTLRGHASVLFRMEKATGVPIEKMGVVSEHEVLMKKGSTFRVKGAVRTKFIGEDVIVITMEQV